MRPQAEAPVSKAFNPTFNTAGMAAQTPHRVEAVVLAKTFRAFWKRAAAAYFNRSSQELNSKFCRVAPKRTLFEESILTIPDRPARMAPLNSAKSEAMLQTTPIPVIAAGFNAPAIASFSGCVSVE